MNSVTFAFVHENSATAITHLVEAIVSTAGAITFFAVGAAGAGPNLALLPSVLAGSLLAAIGAPGLVRVVPTRIVSCLIPLYAVIIAIVLLARIYLF